MDEEKSSQVSPSQDRGSYNEGAYIEKEFNSQLELLRLPLKGIKYLGIWIDDKLKEHIRNMLEAVQKKTLLRIASAYRTSAKALQVIGGAVPIDLQLIERIETFGADKEILEEVKKRARDRSIERWHRGGTILATLPAGPRNSYPI
ncbi:hypothetical protein JTB14_031267 [Gonioctena quinquepunctata]|nr:hypothetical protein JTB14_031267 [Gonioctena quinquepunctata]